MKSMNKRFRLIILCGLIIIVVILFRYLFFSFKFEMESKGYSITNMCESYIWNHDDINCETFYDLEEIVLWYSKTSDKEIIDEDFSMVKVFCDESKVVCYIGNGKFSEEESVRIESLAFLDYLLYLLGTKQIMLSP